MENTTKKLRARLDKLHSEAGLVSTEIQTNLDAARALNWALGLIYSSSTKGPSLEEKILACVSRGLEVAHIDNAQAARMPSNDVMEWFSGPGWYCDLKQSNDVTYPIGPFEMASEAWEEAYIAFNLGAK